MIITDRAKQYFQSLKQYGQINAVKFLVGETNNHRWLYVQGYNTITDTVAGIVPLLCPTDLDTATLDYNGGKLTITAP